MTMNKHEKMRDNLISVLAIICLVLSIIIFTPSVNACHYTVGTFEGDYSTSKISFLKGETVYGRGNAYGYHYLLKLRIRDPDGVVVYYSEESRYEVAGSFELNDTVKTGVWNIQLGIKKGAWKWSESSERISYFSVDNANFSCNINKNGNGTVLKEPNKEKSVTNKIVFLIVFLMMPSHLIKD